MARKLYKPEEIVNLLRQVEVAVANGKMTPQACKEAGIVEQTYYRWRKEYGRLKVDQAKRLKELEQENAKLKRLVSELSLEKLVLKDIASGNFKGASAQVVDLMATMGKRRSAICMPENMTESDAPVG